MNTQQKIGLLRFLAIFVGDVVVAMASHRGISVTKLGLDLLNLFDLTLEVLVFVTNYEKVFCFFSIVPYV